MLPRLGGHLAARGSVNEVVLEMLPRHIDHFWQGGSRTRVTGGGAGGRHAPHQLK